VPQGVKGENGNNNSVSTIAGIADRISIVTKMMAAKNVGCVVTNGCRYEEDSGENGDDH
jgi:hypothetical protein